MSASTFMSTSMLQFVAAYVVVVMVPGPVTFATGGLAVLQGFGKTLPLLAGIGVGRAALTALMAFGAVHLAAALSLPAGRICGAAVLCAMTWRMVRAAPPTTGDSSGRFGGGLFVEGVLIGFLSPQTAALYAVALVGLMLEAPELGKGSRPWPLQRSLPSAGMPPSRLSFRNRLCAALRSDTIAPSAGRLRPRSALWPSIRPCRLLAHSSASLLHAENFRPRMPSKWPDMNGRFP